MPPSKLPVPSASDRSAALPAAPTLLAVDGNSLLHRAFHAYAAAGMTRFDGRASFAVYGFLTLLGGIVERTGPDALVVGFDDFPDNERKVAYQEYKATRKRQADELYQQMDDVRALLGRLGVTVTVAPGWEADDVIASAATVAEQAGWRCVVATSDRDAFSVISETTTVMRLVSGLDNAQWLTPAALVERYGITPEQYIDYAALRGDTSDNLPGIRGIGEKTAAKLLTAFGTVAAALGDEDGCRALIGPAASGKLAAEQGNWRRNVELMTQRRDIDVDLDACRLDVLDADHLAEVLDAAELPGLVSRLAAPLATAADPASRG